MNKSRIGLLTLFSILLLVDVSSAEFFQGLTQGMQQGGQYGLAREQLALQKQQMKLQHLQQWRQTREQEFRSEVAQWLRTAQSWRDATGRPRLTEDEAMSQLDRLRAFDWERQYEQAWMNQK